MTHANAFYGKFLPEKHLKSTMVVKENVGPRFKGNSNLENRVKDTKSNENAISTPVIIGIVVFLVFFTSTITILMFMFYRQRRSKNKQSECSRNTPLHTVKHNPLRVQTLTYQLTTTKPITAAPDYSKCGLDRRISKSGHRYKQSSTHMIKYSSSEDDDVNTQTDESDDKYDCGSPRRRRQNRHEEQQVNGEDDERDASVNEDNNYPSGHIGRIWFLLSYQSSSKILQVNILKIRHLATSVSDSRPNPQVRLYLLPDDRCQHQTAVKSTKNPDFNEVFSFEVARNHLHQRVLRLSVYDMSKGRRGSLIGHAHYPLKNEKFGEELSSDLEKPSEDESKLGVLHVSLAHYPLLDRLTVIVLRATKLPLNKGILNPDTYVKVTFSKGNNVLKMKKTSIQHDTIEPFYNETFHLNVSSDDLPVCTLLFSVYQQSKSDVKGEGKFIGRVLLGGMMYARGKELQHWNDVICQPRTMVKHGHSLAK